MTNLEIKNFKQINLITGKNNSGKTTVLEALFLVSGMSNPQLPVTIANTRDLLLSSDENFNYIFHNLDFNQEPYISAMLDGSIRNLTIKANYASQFVKKVINIEKNKLITGNNTMVNDDDLPVVTGIHLEFDDGKNNEKFFSEISLSGNRVSISNQYKERLRCTFHVPQLSMNMLPQRMEKLFVNKQLEGIIEVLKEIDKKISDIRMGAGGVIYADIGLEKLLPINIMGDGIRRILSIIAAVCDMQGGVLLVDEIENGLHYSTLKILWKALLKALDFYHVQLFATTHSNECIAALSSASKEASTEFDNINLYRIEKQENSHQVFEYSPEIITSAIENNIEMR